MASGTSQIFLDIKNRLEAANPAFVYPASFVPSKTGKFVYLFNAQTDKLKKGRYAGLQPPLIFIELKKVIECQQYGNGDQVLRLIIRIHIVHKFFNAIDGIVNFDQDLPIYEFKDWVYKMLQMFQPTNCGNMVRINEEPDSSHDMLVEYIQDYSLLYTDSLVDQPIDGLQINDTTDLLATITIATET